MNVQNRLLDKMLSLFAIIILFFAASILQAATITVTNLNDSGYGSLRQAIADASSGDLVNFSVSGTIALISGELNIDKNLIIEGPGVNELSISGSNSSPVVDIYSWGIPGGVVVSISNLTIRDGNGIGSTGAGGIRVWSNDLEPSTLRLNNVNIIDNLSDHYGGGIQNLSSIVIITNSAINNNNIGGIFNGHGTLSIANSSISNNIGHRGGGIKNDYGNVSVSNSLISNNRAGLGGGVDNSDLSTFTITNSTISNNVAYYISTLVTVGGGIANFGEVVLINNTITANSAEDNGGGFYNRGAATLSHTIIANNSIGGDCYDFYGIWNSLGHNMDSDGTCNLSQSTDWPNTDPNLGLLGDNGGATETHALLAGSPAIDAGEQNCTDGSEAPLLTDQRGELRPVDGDDDGFVACDIGAFEVQPAITMQVSIDILPKKEVNVINLNTSRIVEVAILSTDDFLAYDQVNPDSIEFGPAAATATRYTVKDINRDGLPDMMFYFKIRETGIECGDTEATLGGETYDGIVFKGSDSILTKGCG